MARDAFFEMGAKSLNQLVRGDGEIGLIDDVVAHEKSMLQNLWNSALTHKDPHAYVALSQCYLAALTPIGAFDGVDPQDAERRSWSDGALRIVDAQLPLQCGLRSLFEAAQLQHRESIFRFSSLTRYSHSGNQRTALALLATLPDSETEVLHHKALVHCWLSELDESFRLHEQAATHGHADSQFELYVFYARGVGVLQNTKRSMEWLQRAADAKQPRAVYNLGSFYATGTQGYEQNFELAKKYYAHAAELGNGRAAATLALMGINQEVDLSRAEISGFLEMAEDLGFETQAFLVAAGASDPREKAAPTAR
jgi:TPR repeat protein